MTLLCFFADWFSGRDVSLIVLVTALVIANLIVAHDDCARRRK